MVVDVLVIQCYDHLLATSDQRSSSSTLLFVATMRTVHMLPSYVMKAFKVHSHLLATHLNVGGSIAAAD